MGRYNTKGQRFEERLNQYIAVYKDNKTNNSKYKELNKIFGNLTFDIGSTDLLYNPDSNMYFISSISEKEASLIIKNLADQSLIYIFTNIILVNLVDQPAEIFNTNIIL